MAAALFCDNINYFLIKSMIQYLSVNLTSKEKNEFIKNGAA